MFTQNTELVVTLIVAAWFVCGIIGAGFYNAYFQRKWPNIRANSDFYSALFYSLFGPIAIIVALSMGGIAYGWSLRRDAVKGWQRQ